MIYLVVTTVIRERRMRGVKAPCICGGLWIKRAKGRTPAHLGAGRSRCRRSKQNRHVEPVQSYEPAHRSQRHTRNHRVYRCYRVLYSVFTDHRSKLGLHTTPVTQSLGSWTVKHRQPESCGTWWSTAVTSRRRTKSALSGLIAPVEPAQPGSLGSFAFSLVFRTRSATQTASQQWSGSWDVV
jgi:hypothetical protein